MSNVMLKELYIDNFKSFHKSKFEFGKINCLIAPNNAGKSNLVEVLEFLEEMIFKNQITSIHNCMIFKPNNYRHSSEDIIINAIFKIKNTILIKNQLIKFDVLFAININLTKLKIEFSLIGKIKNIEIKNSDLKQNIKVVCEYNDDIQAVLNNYNAYIVKLDKKRFRKIDGVNSSNLDKSFQDIMGGLDYLHPMVIRNLFSKSNLFSSFYFHPQTIKKQQNYETNFLLKDGTNLAYFLDTVDEEIFDSISMSLIGEVELIESIEITEGSVPTIIFNEKVNGEIKKIIQQKVSDGTIHFLSLMSALYGSKANCLIFEEPERHMHMKTLSYILNSMRDSEKQIFFTTHSTEILNQLELDEILFMFRDFDGDTQGKRAKNIPHIKKFMKMYKNDLVEMIQTGIVGEYEED
jgi:AAA15 family ATPase/GTPase